MELRLVDKVSIVLDESTIGAHLQIECVCRHSVLADVPADNFGVVHRLSIHLVSLSRMLMRLVADNSCVVC